MKTSRLLLGWLASLLLSGAADAEHPAPSGIPVAEHPDTTAAFEAVKKLEPLPTWEMCVAAYTREFAKRFNLPEPAEDMIPTGGIAAIDFRIRYEEIFDPRTGDQLGPYRCDWRIYLDKNVSFDFPEPDRAGDGSVFGHHRLMDAGGPEDNRVRNERSTPYFRRIQFSTVDYVPDRRGARESNILYEYARDLVPGIDYLRTQSCSFGNWYRQQPRDIVLWLKKGGTPDDRMRLRPPEEFHRFTLPRGFIAKAAPLASRAEDYILVIGKANSQRNLERVRAQQAQERLLREQQGNANKPN